MRSIKKYLLCFFCLGLLTPFLACAELTLEQALSNIDNQTDEIKLFIVSVSYVIGVGLCFSGVMKLKKYGTRTAFMAVETSMIGPLLQFFIGVALFYLPDFLQSINITLYNSGIFATQTNFFDSSVIVPNQYSNYINPILHIVQIIGLVSFIRGWVQLSKVSGAGQSQPGTISKAITHIITGSLAVNIYQVFNMLQATLGAGT